MMAVRRFCARRGSPKKIYSDNGRNFIGASQELKRCLAEWDQNQMVSTLANLGIEWHFIPPQAPHMGGCWERLIRSVKTTMTAILKSQQPRDEVLLTVFAEAEGIVNSRPLTHVSIDPQDQIALTPNHFLIGVASIDPLHPAIPETVNLRKAWMRAQQLTDCFWRRWVKEYRPTLLRKSKWFNSDRPLQIGDVVTIMDPNNLRNSWPMGIVQATYPGKDGQVRVVDVQTTDGTYRRPVTKLCLMKVQDPENSAVEDVAA
ncbi:Pao retrotransposon peptidase [Nesidiocoris tenuis]|uniref:Pao retrotransposon peptidase n=1 Tax=Nesidiocoris tenuis TaxID=355587 RepID=A0ABN7AZG7_9HEMI|nr:Pao retrotransposon peptidase [Nesidiocoris tenuis]